MWIDFYWYRPWRVWVITQHDAEGNQIGEAEYAPNKRMRDDIIKRLTTI